ncbi:MAG: GGDEF domain-containing protein [Candidatus Omnitrophica bacterium]|nr:GGDEF domain-containing protein [Candidatus Omnitrophota bacterium]
MLHIILYLIMTAVCFLLLRDSLARQLACKTAELDKLFMENSGLLKDKRRLEEQNSGLVKAFSQTLELYELTKDICKSLEEVRVFNIFRQNLEKHIGATDCRYIKDSAELVKYKDYTVLPLDSSENQPIGYLACGNVAEEDRDKLSILAQQLLIGLRRAVLYQKVSELAIIDTLTQVYSRRYFLERFSEELRRSRNNKLHMCFLLADIDNFKQYNDRYGHLVGDGILRQVSKTIRDTIRQIDFIGRYGGEELSIVLAETDSEQANFAAERIRQAVASDVIKVYDEKLKVTVSIGVSAFPENSGQLNDLIELADQALYQAKATGKNKVCFSPA